MWGYIDDDDPGDWEAPDTLPEIAGAKVIALDTETYDPNLTTRGAGDVFNDGHIIGLSVAVSDDDKWYLPVRNEFNEGFSIGAIREWADRTFTADCTIVGANLIYDLGWLEYHGIKLKGHYYDVQWAEALIDEHRDSYSLDAIGQSYDVGGKDSGELYEWCAQKFGGKPDGRQRKHMHEAPLSLVGPYAETDAALPVNIMAKQTEIIDRAELNTVLDVEHRLLPMLLAMRKRGVRVDMNKRDEVSAFLDKEMHDAHDQVRSIAGRDVNVNAAADIAKVFDANGWEYPLTAKAQKPSFTGAFLSSHESPFAQAIVKMRKYAKMKGTFVDGYFESAYNGRLHGNLHPLRSGYNGTVSGRISSSKPCLQNLPSRDKVLGPLIRSLFVPEDGERWECQDFSQIEYRFLAHYAIGKGSDEVRRKYCTDPTTDFHKLVQDDTGMDRKKAKCLNFGMCIEEGQLVLTDQGLVPIEQVTLEQKLWDGVEWVSHDGAIEKGIKYTVDYCGLRATYNHKVWSDKGIKMPLFEAVMNDIPLAKCGDGLKNLPAFNASCPPSKEGTVKLRPVYDILNAGPRHRFTCSDILVSNCYGQGLALTAESMGVSESEAAAFRDTYFERSPYVRATSSECMHRAQARGWIKTILGRRARFNMWEPRDFDLSKELGNFRSKEECMKVTAMQLGSDIPSARLVKRARTYKALNSLLQGSAADLMKKSMVDIWESGVCGVLGAPLLTIHDELDWSVPQTPEGREAIKEAGRLMCNALALRVPVKIDHEAGPDWGHATEDVGGD